MSQLENMFHFSSLVVFLTNFELKNTLFCLNKGDILYPKYKNQQKVSVNYLNLILLLISFMNSFTLSIIASSNALSLERLN